MMRVYDFPVNAQSFLAESPLRSRHDAVAARETGRRTAAVSAARGESAAGRKSQVGWIAWGQSAEVLAVCDSVETEYAAIRRGAAIVDLPQRGTVEVRGADRIDFLQRMITQDVRALQPRRSVRSFWLNRKGRIEADMLLSAVGDRIIIDLPRAVAASTVASLGAFVFSEDVQIIDCSPSEYRVAVHGPQAFALLAHCAVDSAALDELARDAACAEAKIAGVPAVLTRCDSLGTVGIEVSLATTDVPRVWDAWTSLHDVAAGGVPRARVCGWLAMNIARIEAGEPMFEIDFGSAALPHETGVIASRVSMTKGCYLGQEVVARMQSLGKPKQVVCALRIEEGAFPVEGTQLFLASTDGGAGDEVGVITSSTVSPMLGSAVIGFATIRQAHAAPDTKLRALCDGQLVQATVQASLRSLPSVGEGSVA